MLCWIGAAEFFNINKKAAKNRQNIHFSYYDPPLSKKISTFIMTPSFFHPLCPSAIVNERSLKEASILSDTHPPGRVEFPGGGEGFFRKSPHPLGRKISESPHPRGDFMVKNRYFLSTF